MWPASSGLSLPPSLLETSVRVQWGILSLRHSDSPKQSLPYFHFPASGFSVNGVSNQQSLGEGQPAEAIGVLGCVEMLGSVAGSGGRASRTNDPELS